MLAWQGDSLLFLNLTCGHAPSVMTDAYEQGTGVGGPGSQPGEQGHIPWIYSLPLSAVFPTTGDWFHSPINHGGVVSLKRQNSLKFKKKNTDGNERDEEGGWERCTQAPAGNAVLRSSFHFFRF